MMQLPMCYKISQKGNGKDCNPCSRRHKSFQKLLTSFEPTTHLYLLHYIVFLFLLTLSDQVLLIDYVQAVNPVKLFFPSGQYFIKIIYCQFMCQGLLLCQTSYFNCCFSCMGCSIGVLCCNCWVCPDPIISHMRFPGCINITTSSGCGCSAFCTAFYCCAPQHLINYSIRSSVSDRVGQIYDLVISRQAVIVRDEKRPISERQMR